MNECSDKIPDINIKCRETIRQSINDYATALRQHAAKSGKILIIVEKSRTGYSAYAEDYAAFTTGSALCELVDNMVESLNLYFEAEGSCKTVTAQDLVFIVEKSK